MDDARGAFDLILSIVSVFALLFMAAYIQWGRNTRRGALRARIELKIAISTEMLRSIESKRQSAVASGTTRNAFTRWTTPISGKRQNDLGLIKFEISRLIEELAQENDCLRDFRIHELRDLEARVTTIRQNIFRLNDRLTAFSSESAMPSENTPMPIALGVGVGAAAAA